MYGSVYKVIDSNKLKTFADDKLVKAEMISVKDRSENIVGGGQWKREKCCLQVFSSFSFNVFKSPFSQGCNNHKILD